MEAERNIPIFKTPCQTEREERDLAIYNEYQQMTSVIVDIVRITITTIDTVITMNQTIGKIKYLRQ